jgi:hypothetical protein
VKNLRTIAGTAIFFGLVGPAAGSLTSLVDFGSVGFVGVAAAYLIGIIPALLAGAAYGAVRVRTKDSSSSWYVRAFRGALAGLVGSVLFCLGVLLSGTMPPGFGFFRTITAIGILAGALCAVLLRPR